MKLKKYKKQRKTRRNTKKSKRNTKGALPMIAKLKKFLEQIFGKLVELYLKMN